MLVKENVQLLMNGATLVFGFMPYGARHHKLLRRFIIPPSREFLTPKLNEKSA